MRIIICDYSGHPFQVELSRCLATRGHRVLHLHFEEFQTPKGKLSVLPGDSPNFEVEGLRIGRTFDKRRFVSRWFLEAKVGELVAARARRFRPDVVVGCNMPLDAQRKLRNYCARNGVRFVFWLQDIYSRAIYHYLSEKFGAVGQMAGLYYKHLEGKLLRSSDAVVAISEKFLEPLEKWGVRRERVRVVPNWAPLSEIYPVGKDNGWARRYALHDKLVALYTGTLGLKHDPALLLELARAGSKVGVEVAVVSEGASVEWLEKRKREMNVENLTLLPFQPMELYPEVLGAGDILLAMVGEEAAAFSVPSKILSYLAAGKPIVASIAGDNDAARMIRAAQAGFVVEPGDRAAFFDNVVALASGRELRETLGRNARAFAESRFEIETIADQFEEVFALVVQPSGGRGGVRPSNVPDEAAKTVGVTST